MDFPKYNRRETGVYGLTDAGKQWLMDFVKEGCDMLGVIPTAMITRSSDANDEQHGEREHINFKLQDIGFSCSSQFLNNQPCSTLFLMFHPYTDSIDFQQVASREAALKVLMCAIIAACPERFLEQIKASVVK